MTYITADEVRNASGVPTSLITDAQLNEWIAQVEEEMERWLNTSFAPKETIEIVDGNATSRMFVKKNPLLSVRELTVNDSTSITPAYIDWYKPSGKLWLSTSAESATFTQGQQNTFVKYIYGFVKESSTDTTTTADVTAGNTVSLTVSSISGFSDGDWVEIYGMDGKREAAQITAAPSGSTIVVDKLVKAHESGSKVVLLAVPEYIKKYMIIEAAICAAINAIGATYTFNASYSLGELSVTKGVPYTHWKASMDYLLKEREMRKSRIKPRPSILVN